MDSAVSIHSREVSLMALAFHDKNSSFTYGDYLTWDNEERWELIDGIPYNMTPAPSTLHQRILIELSRQFSNYLRGKPCEVFAAPFDVRLPKSEEADEAVTTVVQPDIVVICDASKLDKRGCRGAPDIVIEILSPSTAQKDIKIKLSLYERAGVKEFWIVYPEGKTVMVFTLQQQGRYGRPEVYSDKDAVTPVIFGDLSIELSSVFSDAQSEYSQTSDEHKV